MTSGQEVDQGRGLTAPAPKAMLQARFNSSHTKHSQSTVLDFKQRDLGNDGTIIILVLGFESSGLRTGRQLATDLKSDSWEGLDARSYRCTNSVVRWT